ncbi:MAG: hypothetical protein WCG47_12915 [Dermatophilaceae bacterium]
MPQEQRSVGRTYSAPDGTTYRPSMFLTLTLGSLRQGQGGVGKTTLSTNVAAYRS